VEVARYSSHTLVLYYFGFPELQFFTQISVCASVFLSVSLLTLVKLELPFTAVWVAGSIAEWLACWTKAQWGLGSNRIRDAVG